MTTLAPAERSLLANDSAVRSVIPFSCVPRAPVVPPSLPPCPGSMTSVSPLRVPFFRLTFFSCFSVSFIVAFVETTQFATYAFEPSGNFTSYQSPLCPIVSNDSPAFARYTTLLEVEAADRKFVPL